MVIYSITDQSHSNIFIRRLSRVHVPHLEGQRVRKTKVVSLAIIKRKLIYVCR